MSSPDTALETVEKEIDILADKNVDSVDTDARYLAYFARIRTAIRASTRYVAYTSDVGEAFRPIVPPWAVSAAYGVSWLYIGTDVAYETYKAHKQGPSAVEAAVFAEPVRLSLAAVQRMTFQSIASMGLPALTIHTTVNQAKKLFVNAQNPRTRAWGPTLTGLAVVPALPYLFDHPVETATDHAFDWIRQKLAKKSVDDSKKDL
ncbi:hypothetical protein CYLTODRAFT_428330 [Cylindrobasidium torrendii FP15055 ss-10]|uniref:Mitochondrial fission process protein 1 n=1 Tax=Cylindrobasidium torrendii FP15055 ss-10 TaxID=1314674 RepID=A0A0D7BVY6_9AGAR|nr:hypothetical protein CYLTODRAFT_428330 [Cylindrobasidium torrendii FP15055 ss-10]